MPDTPDIAEVEAIARKLTKAQRACVLALGHWGDFYRSFRDIAANAEGIEPSEVPAATLPIDIAELRRLHEAATPGGEHSCDLCGGAGERFVHHPDCHNDSCALAGGIDDCDGMVETCVCAERLANAAGAALPALLDRIEAEEWRPIETAPGDDCAALLYFAGERDETVLLGNDYALSIGFWRNGRLHEQGTGHDILTEAKSGFCSMPTAWKRISPPTTGGDDA